MPQHARRVPPQHTITVRGLTREQVQQVKAFAAQFTRPLGIAVHVDRADKDKELLLLYCNFESLQDAENARDGLSQFLLQTLPVISEFHHVPALVFFASTHATSVGRCMFVSDICTGHSCRWSRRTR